MSPVAGRTSVIVEILRPTAVGARCSHRAAEYVPLAQPHYRTTDATVTPADSRICRAYRHDMRGPVVVTAARATSFRYGRADTRSRSHRGYARTNRCRRATPRQARSRRPRRRARIRAASSEGWRGRTV